MGKDWSKRPYAEVQSGRRSSGDGGDSDDGGAPPEQQRKVARELRQLAESDDDAASDPAAALAPAAAAASGAAAPRLNAKMRRRLRQAAKHGSVNSEREGAGGSAGGGAHSSPAWMALLSPLSAALAWDPSLSIVYEEEELSEDVTLDLVDGGGREFEVTPPRYYRLPDGQPAPWRVKLEEVPLIGLRYLLRNAFHKEHCVWLCRISSRTAVRS